MKGRALWCRANWKKGNHILAKEVLAKHDENYTPPEVEKAMEANHRRPASVYRTQHRAMPEIGNGLLCLALELRCCCPYPYRA